MICLRLYITDPPCRPDATLLVSRRADLSPRPATLVAAVGYNFVMYALETKENG